MSFAFLFLYNNEEFVKKWFSYLIRDLDGELSLGIVAGFPFSLVGPPLIAECLEWADGEVFSCKYPPEESESFFTGDSLPSFTGPVGSFLLWGETSTSWELQSCDLSFDVTLSLQDWPVFVEVDLAPAPGKECSNIVSVISTTCQVENYAGK